MAGERSSVITQNLKQLIALAQDQVGQLRHVVQSPTRVDYPAFQLVVSQAFNNLQRLDRQVAQLEDDHANLLALAEISQVVNSSLELSAVLEIVMDTIIQLTGAERGFLMLTGEEISAARLTPRVARNWEKASLDSSEFKISQTIVERVVVTGEAVLTTNAQEDPRFEAQQSIISYSLRSILCVPLKVKEVLTGVIYADNRIRTGIFTEAKRNLLVAFANQAAVAIENARLFESIQRTLLEVTELKNLMGNILTSIPSGVITADSQDLILLCNEAAVSILGLPSDGCVGVSLQDILPRISTDLLEKVSQVREHSHPLVGIEYGVNLPHRGQAALVVSLSPLLKVNEGAQGVVLVIDDYTERKRLEAQQSLFKRMVSPAVIDQLDPDELRLGGKRVNITTLFADVRGFTALGEKCAPEQLVTILNRYLSAAAAAVLEQNGTIDKFLGDSIMAWFNAPIPQADHTLRAVKAGLSMVREMETLHREIDAPFQLSFGVGIHYGEAVLGLIGNELRLDYTAIGDSVNTAKRIQENAAGGQILISDAAFRMVANQVIARPVEPVLAKGKSQPIYVYEILGLA
jgi:PAS domain S-box-containing protein